MAHQPAQATLLQINLRSTAPVGAHLTICEEEEISTHDKLHSYTSADQGGVQNSVNLLEARRAG